MKSERGLFFNSDFESELIIMFFFLFVFVCLIGFKKVIDGRVLGLARVAEGGDWDEDLVCFMEERVFSIIVEIGRENEIFGDEGAKN